MQSTLTFDETYCHSAGQETAQTYRIKPRTTELRFVFPDFEGFWQTYINRNPHLANETLIALRDGQAVFSTAVVQGAEYRSFDGAGDDGIITLNGQSLMAFGHDTPFPGFTRGALAFGIHHSGAHRFEVLWATLYETA